MCFWCSKETSHRDGSFEYPQYMFWLRNKKNNFQLHSLIGGHVYVSQMMQFLFHDVISLAVNKVCCWYLYVTVPGSFTLSQTIDYSIYFDAIINV